MRYSKINIRKSRQAGGRPIFVLVLIFVLSLGIINLAQTSSLEALTDRQIEDRAQAYCDRVYLNNFAVNSCKTAYIASAKSKGKPSNCNEACQDGYKAGQKDRTTGNNNTPAPKRSDCDKKIKPNECKKEYDKCNKLQGPRIEPAVKRCKQEVLKKYDDKQADQSQPSVPARSECNDAAKPAECKKEYDKCEEGSKPAAQVRECKRKVINDHKTEESNKLSVGSEGTHQCGNLPNDDDNFKTKINFGCLGEDGPAGLGPIQDLIFALIRFLTIGVGIIITLSIIAAGIQYTTAEGNAESTQKAKKRIQNAIIGLIIFIFAWSAMQFLIPGGLFRPGSWLLWQLITIRLGVGT
ncbi:MAG TPA: hypothetical protein VD947_00830 [Patescibacteria group bacterium]|nr:hypothetical protein [Patescibacteria group bacterium]